MKWSNIGHEFDEAYKCIEGLEGIYLLGAGHDGQLVYEVLTKRYPGLKILGIIDNDTNKQGKKFNGFNIKGLKDIKKEDAIGIVISFASEFTTDIDNQLTDAGFEKNKTFWHFEEFVSIYAGYKYDEVFFSSICILPTTACNLRCKACLNFTSYIKKFEHRPLEQLKEEIDLYFKCVNYTGLFFISGGEPLLYSDLVELIYYVAHNYSEQYYELGMVTNGTIEPSEKLLVAIKECKVKLTIDDYRDQLVDKSESISKNINKAICELDENQACVRKYDTWISLYPHSINDFNEKNLIEKYDRCHCPWQEYRGGKLYSCNYAGFAETAGIVECDEINDSYELKSFTNETKKSLMEFRLGFTKKGYVNFCKNCAGYMDLNPYKVRAAEQE